MSYFLKVFFFILKIFNSLVPKSKKKILFISRPDYADNAKHMYDYFVKNNPEKKQLSWLIYDKYAYDILKEKGLNNIYYLKTVRGVFEYLRSKYIITSSSSLWQVKSLFQKQFDLWHGIPLKTILCMEDMSCKTSSPAVNVDMRFATSSLTKALLAASFNFSAKDIKITGQPRTDCLFETNNELYDFLKIENDKYSKIVLYMPTYRSGYKDKNDGTSIQGNNVFRFEYYDHLEFSKFLKQENILFLFKLHPYEEALYRNVIEGDNIKLISHEALIKEKLDIHELLNNIDILITDYSSVYFDYLLLDKQLIFIPTDKEIYENKRGFNLEPYEFWTPGEKVYRQETLEDALVASDKHEDTRKVICNIMHTYQDTNACDRVYDEIKKSL